MAKPGGRDRQVESGEEVSGYRAPIALMAAGVTYRQLDYWARTDLVTPSQPAAGSGSQRLYAVKDIVALRAAKRLLDCGISLAAAKPVIGWIREGLPATDVILVSDGQQVDALDANSESISDYLHAGPVYAIDLAAITRDVQAVLDAHEKAQEAA